MWTPDDLDLQPSFIGWGQADMDLLPDDEDDRDQVVMKEGKAVMVPKDSALRPTPLFDDPFTDSEPADGDTPGDDSATQLEDIL